MGCLVTVKFLNLLGSMDRSLFKRQMVNLYFYSVGYLFPLLTISLLNSLQSGLAPLSTGDFGFLSRNRSSLSHVSLFPSGSFDFEAG